MRRAAGVGGFYKGQFTKVFGTLSKHLLMLNTISKENYINKIYNLTKSLFSSHGNSIIGMGNTIIGMWQSWAEGR